MKTTAWIVAFVSVLAIASFLAAGRSTARAKSEVATPHFGVFSGHPASGTVFTGVTATFPSPGAVAIQRLLCKATLGGDLVFSPGGNRVLGGVVLHPIIHPYFEAGHPGLTAITCGWRIPLKSAGKILTLRPPRDREIWGFVIVYRARERDSRLGPPRTAVFRRGTWRIRG